MEGDYHSSDKFHQAGYDAYMTGFIFVKMSAFIGAERDLLFKGIEKFDHLNDFVNFLYIMQNDTHLNLNAKENPIQDRSHIFHVSNFPSLEVKNDDIRKLFKKYGRIKIDWIDDDSTFVSLDEKEKSMECLEELSTNTTFKVVSYDLFRNPVVIPSQVSQKKRKRDFEQDSDPLLKKKKEDSQCIIS
jgi:RNA recognition motif-containing protein